MPLEAIPIILLAVSFPSSSFSKYKLGVNNQLLEYPLEDRQSPSLKDVIEHQASSWSNQHRRISVCETSKCDKNLVAAAKLHTEAKLREMASLEGHVL